jgi:hypothetical protein
MGYRPLGYERNFASHAGQYHPSKAKQTLDSALRELFRLALIAT